MVGMSQDRLGQMVGLTFQQIQKYEKGANRIGASRLYQFATLLNVPPAYFFEGLEGQPVTSRDGRSLEAAVPADSGTTSFTREDVDLLRAFHGLQQPSLRRRIIDLVWAMNTDASGAAASASGAAQDAPKGQDPAPERGQGPIRSRHSA